MWNLKSFVIMDNVKIEHLNYVIIIHSKWYIISKYSSQIMCSLWNITGDPVRLISNFYQNVSLKMLNLHDSDVYAKHAKHR